MELVLTRRDGALAVRPAPPYLVKYLRYYHRGFKIEHYQTVNDFQEKLLHQMLPDGSLITLPGFFEKIVKMIADEGDVYQILDERTPLPVADWEAIRNINWSFVGSSGLRDYQVDPIAQMLFKAQTNSGIIAATGGFGLQI